jgi:hypothetical protein
MPVCIEERPHRTAVWDRAYRLRQRAGVLRKAAIHQHNAVGPRARHYVATGTAEQVQVLAQWRGINVLGGCNVRVLS